MTQKFLDDGTVAPITRIQAGPCFVAAKKNYGEGERAVQLAWDEISANKLNSALKGFFKKIFGREIGYKELKEFRLKSDDQMFDKLSVGQKFDASIFNVGDLVDVQGISRGLGFQGVVKRHHFRGGKKSHGHKDQLRMPGSIGAKGPAHVFKGSRMGGRMGAEVVTIKNLEVISIDPVKNELWVKGAVPGARHGILYIKATGNFEIKIEQPEKPVEQTIERSAEKIAEQSA